MSKQKSFVLTLAMFCFIAASSWHKVVPADQAMPSPVPPVGLVAQEWE